MNAKDNNELRLEVERLKAELKASKELVDIATSFFGFLTPDGKVIDLNNLSLKAVEAQRSEIIGKFFWDCPWWASLSESVKSLKDAIKLAQNGKKSELEVQYNFIENEKKYFRWGRLLVNPIMSENGQVDRISVSGTDITEFKDVAASLEREKLLRSVKNLKLEKELRERFVAALTHDLRTPLTAAKMSAEILRKKNLNSDQFKKHADRIIDNMDRANLMIRDLLDASRIKAGEKVPLEFNKCNLSLLVRDTMDDLSTIFGDRFVIQVEKNAYASVASGAIRRVIENLVGNAIKYGSKNTPITVSLKTEDDDIEISVHNHGKEIPSEDLVNIFELYHRTDAASESEQKGWGLGLTLVRGLTEAHAGKALVTSSKEAGTKFTICLPINSKPS